MNTKNRQRTKLALAELEKEMEVLTTEEASTCKWGIGQYDKDCFWRCVAYFKLEGTITEAMAEPFLCGVKVGQVPHPDEQHFKQQESIVRFLTRGGSPF